VLKKIPEPAVVVSICTTSPGYPLFLLSLRGFVKTPGVMETVPLVHTTEELVLEIWLDEPPPE
jgi:hypothetical protein